MRPAAGILLVRGDGAVFLLRRSADVPLPYHWNTPGGGIEPGETFMEAATREFREEAGSLPRAQTIAAHDRNGYVTVVAAVSSHEAARWEPVLNWESDAWGWFPIDDLPVPLHPGLEELLDGMS